MCIRDSINPLQKKRLGLQQGYKPRYKRAIVTVKRGQEITTTTLPNELLAELELDKQENNNNE